MLAIPFRPSKTRSFGGPSSPVTRDALRFDIHLQGDGQTAFFEFCEMVELFRPIFVPDEVLRRPSQP